MPRMLPLPALARRTASKRRLGEPTPWVVDQPPDLGAQRDLGAQSARSMWGRAAPLPQGCSTNRSYSALLGLRTRTPR